MFWWARPARPALLVGTILVLMQAGSFHKAVTKSQAQANHTKQHKYNAYCLSVKPSENLGVLWADAWSAPREPAGWMWRGPANFLAYMTGTELPSLCWTHGRWKGSPLLLHSALPRPKSRSRAELMATIASVEALWNHHLRNLLSPSTIAGAYYVEGGMVILALGASCVFVLIRLIQ